MPPAPGTLPLLIFEQATVSIVDAAMQHQFTGARLQFRQREFAQQRNWIVIQLIPSHRIQIKEQSNGIVIPAPPQIARQRPQPLLRRNDESVERSGFANDRSHLPGSFGQHTNFIFRKNSGFDRLHNQNTLQYAAIDQRNAQERLIGVLA